MRSAPPQQPLPITISIGYAEGNPRLKMPQAVIKALYHARHNRISA